MLVTRLAREPMYGQGLPNCRWEGGIYRVVGGSTMVGGLYSQHDSLFPKEAGRLYSQHDSLSLIQNQQ